MAQAGASNQLVPPTSKVCGRLAHLQPSSHIQVHIHSVRPHLCVLTQHLQAQSATNLNTNNRQ